MPDFIDTLFIDHDINNWSLRIFTNYKDHSFQLNNADQKLVYVPSNPGGIGFGVATRKLIIDCGFNPQLRDKERTERFDFRMAFMQKKHYFAYFLQSYHGFNLQANKSFRHDISSLSSGLNYMYVFNAEEYSVSAMKSGLSKQKKTALSFGLGAFAFYNKTSADSSIVPTYLQPFFNNEAMLIGLHGFGGGVQGEFGMTVPFLTQFFVSGSLTPGIGLIKKDVQTEFGTYSPSDYLLAHAVIEGILGYNGTKYYVNLAMQFSLYKTGIDFGNQVGYKTAQAKFAVGYKLGRK